MTKNIPRRMALLSLVSVFLFLGILSFGIFTIAGAMNKRAAADSKNLVAAQLNSRSSALIAISIDYNNWDEAYDNVVDLDFDSFYNNYASATANGNVFSQLTLLNAFGHETVYWDADTGETPLLDTIGDAMLAEFWANMVCGTNARSMRVVTKSIVA